MAVATVAWGVAVTLGLACRPLRPARLTDRPACARSRVLASDDRDPPVRSILDMEQFARVKDAADVVAVAASRSQGRGKEANDALIAELVASDDANVAIQVHYDWVSSIKFLRGLQVRSEAAVADTDRRAKLSFLMARIREEMQARMDTATRLVAENMAAMAADPYVTRRLVRRGQLDEAVVLMLVAHAQQAGRTLRAREDAGAEGVEDLRKAHRLVQRVAQEAMQELDVAVSPEFLIVRRLLQTRSAAARRDIVSRASAGDQLVVPRPIDVAEVRRIVSDFVRMEEAEDAPCKDSLAKYAVILSELSASG